MSPKRADKESRRIAEVLERLEEHYPDATCALHHTSAFELLGATILSAQCTDERVNKVTPGLFEVFPDAAAMADADPGELQELIRSTGFFRNKSRSLIGACRRIRDEFGGEVPETMEELLTLPGVARKTANVVLGTWFGVADGIVVDTHVKRLSSRLGLARSKTPDQIEKELMRKVPREQWIDLSHRLIRHGRLICKAAKPRCLDCFLPDVCPYYAESGPGASKI